MSAKMSKEKVFATIEANIKNNNDNCIVITLDAEKTNLEKVWGLLKSQFV